MLTGLLRTMRPHQWVKNLFVVAPLVFAKGLLQVEPLLRTLAGFVLFCLAAGSVYILNDLADLEADRAHPKKRLRPIASGAVPERAAKMAFVGLVATTVVGGLLLAPAFAAVLVAYLVLNLAYTFRLKHMAYVDVLCIATGFELRVLGGTLAAPVPPTAYLLLVTFLLATFLGLGKRMHELMQGERATKQRSVLQRYDVSTLRFLLYFFGLVTVGTYAAYSFDPQNRIFFGTPYLPITTLFTLFGVLRFLRLVQFRPDAESPTDEMLRDKPFLLNLALWGLVTVTLIYLA